MSVLAFLLFGLLPGYNEKTMIYVLPETGLVVACDMSVKSAKFFDLKLSQVGELSLAGVLEYACEAKGNVFLNLRDEDKFTLVVTDRNLRMKRSTNNITLFYPSVIDGVIHATDKLDIYTRKRNYPKLARAFDTRKLRYAEKYIYKLPIEYADQSSFPEQHWIFKYGSSFLALMQSGFKIYILDHDYISRLSIDTERSPTQIRDKITIPIGVIDPLKEKFRLSRVVRCNDMQQEFIDWSNNNTIIFNAWSLDGVIYLAFGTFKSNITTVAFLDGSFNLNVIGNWPGIAVAGHKRTVWCVDRAAGQAFVTAHSF